MFSYWPRNKSEISRIGLMMALFDRGGVKNEYRRSYVISRILRDYHIKHGAELTKRITATFTEQKYFDLTNTMLLMVFENNLRLKSISLSAFFSANVVERFCKPCAKLLGHEGEKNKVKKN